MKAERKAAVAFLGTAGGEVLISYLRRRWREGPPAESGDQMVHRLGRLDALAHIERLREEAKG